MQIAYFLVPFAGGLAAMLVRLPPLVGFLGAGFALNAMGYESTPELEKIAELGVTLLLFTIGLKLNVRTLFRKEVWAAASVHVVASTVISIGLLVLVKFTGIFLLAEAGMTTVVVLAFALSFSSTVFAVKALEERSETRSLFGRTTIGILVMQDIFAVVYISASSGDLPSPWALALVLLIPAAPLMRALLPRIGHGEMQILYGVVLALVVGYGLFEHVGLKGDLGALIIGMLLATHPSAGGLSKSLFEMKELFLVGFFVSIGLAELPTWQSLGMAVVLLILLPVKGAFFMLILTGFRLRYRTALLATLSLTNFSEFGLIVADKAVGKGWLTDQWVVVISISVSLSFVIAALLNTFSPQLYERAMKRLPAQDPVKLHPADRPIDLNAARAVVLGMGRVGHGAYDRLSADYGIAVLGIDSDEDKVTGFAGQGYNVIEADATDPDFWDKLLLTDTVELVMLAMPDHSGNIFAIEQLHHRSFGGRIAAIVKYSEEMEQLRERGVDEVFHIYDEAGVEFADKAAESIGLPPVNGPDS
ncbi:cation:proton antiporter family protein [Antrihabitans sp. YC2-6]|uniref:cation:proton antiporter family protein n=1 Tax=Antrihabitans sp. YC2-6 TaxID=2799498 RepID=UPI0018F39B73|nr:cation:proton antiporter family protein [Antrihabitans sp. YC2-6]MBJ8347658.1 cation:proton antiporter [Antrihabitans sp. YC2-6]